MRYRQDLQVALRERYRRILTENFMTAGSRIRLIVDWIEKQPALRAILAEAAHAEPVLHFDAFHASITRDFSWPCSTEAGRATLVWQLLQHIAEDVRTGRMAEDDVAMHYGSISLKNHTNDMWREFVERIVAPLFDYLGEQVGAENSVLYVLERYTRRVEWFDRDELHKAFKTNTRNGEEVYNLDLQRFMFLDGNYKVHAKPRSASGEVDLLGDVDEELLICDGKIFDGEGRGRGYLAKGFNQVVHYAQDHQRSVAYLVVFDMAGRGLEFPSDGPSGMWPPYIEMSGVRVYFVVIRALPPQTTASKLGKAQPYVISRDELLNPDEAEFAATV